MINSMHTFENLLHDFLKTNSTPNERTFLEIGGFPHYERVISNFLAFFLDPKEEHKFKTLMLQAIQNLLKISGELSDVVIETEMANIDIVVSSSTHVIAIENKIYHHADSNPFESYVKTVKGRFPGLSHYFAILTPFPETIQRKQEYLAKLNYVILTYDELFSEIRILMGDFAASASNRHWLLLIDFMETIKNISKGSNFDQASLIFFEKNSTTIAELLKKINSFRTELRGKVKGLHNILIEKHPSVLEDSRLIGKGGYYRENEDPFFDTFYVEIAFPNGALVGCDVIVKISGWEIRVVPRNGNNYQALLNYLSHSGLEFDESGDRFALKNIKLPSEINADLGLVADVAAFVIDRLKSGIENANQTKWFEK
jgi:hypothetical protein